MNVYLLRHGPALSRESWDGPDELRPLTSDGEDLVYDVASRIRRLGLALDVVLTSPYERALRTATVLCERLADETPLIQDPRLEPGRFDADALVTMAQPYEDAGAIMMVGHDPSMSTAISDLVGGGRFSLRKGGLARVDLDPASPETSTLVWFVPPRLLR
jgi:phosphohistidine phosphatase SixA